MSHSLKRDINYLSIGIGDVNPCNIIFEMSVSTSVSFPLSTASKVLQNGKLDTSRSPCNGLHLEGCFKYLVWLPLFHI